jgi:hypothetical protein
LDGTESNQYQGQTYTVAHPAPDTMPVDPGHEFVEVVRRYRLGLRDPHAPEKLSHEKALALMRKFGFTTGEALRPLRPKERGE